MPPIEIAEHLLPGSILAEASGWIYDRLRPLTDFRRDRDEARILYICRRRQDVSVYDSPDKRANYVMKVKFQASHPDLPNKPLPGPSSFTTAEIEALQMFKDKALPFVPHFVDSQLLRQPMGLPAEVEDRRDLFQVAETSSTYPPLLSGGYISILIMTMLPGQDLYSLKFWSMPMSEREEIRVHFWQHLTTLWAAGIAPSDCALRNILWDQETKQCSIVDFEQYDRRPIASVDPLAGVVGEHVSEITAEAKQLELQRWGLVHRPAALSFAHEWGILK